MTQYESGTSAQVRRFRLGLIINPFAGMGGPAGLKGSDGSDIVAQAQALGQTPRAPDRALRCLQPLAALPIDLYTIGGAMGEAIARAAGFAPVVVQAASEPSTAEDTRRAAKALKQQQVDLILFVGGDGTARDIYAALGDSQPVLGLPSGVKMHSSVYAIVPEAATEIVRAMVEGRLVALDLGEVRDIDEDAFRAGRVQSRYYGELQVPAEPRYIQAVKQGGVESEPLVLDDIAADIREAMEPDTLYIFAPGSTTFAVTEAMGLDATLLGVDVVQNESLVAKDVDAASLEQRLAAHRGRVVLVVTAIGGQGHVFGRGNQQLSPAVLKRIGRDNIWIIATKTKLEALQGRPLLLDTNDPILDREWAGHIRVITGYRDAVLYPLGMAL